MTFGLIEFWPKLLSGTDLAGVESRVEDTVLVRLVAVVVAERVQRHRAQRIHTHLLLVRLEVVLALQCSADMLRFFEAQQMVQQDLTTCWARTSKSEAEPSSNGTRLPNLAKLQHRRLMSIPALSRGSRSCVGRSPAPGR